MGLVVAEEGLGVHAPFVESQEQVNHEKSIVVAGVVGRVRPPAQEGKPYEKQ